MDDMAKCPLCGGEPIMRIKWIDTRKALYSIGCPKCRLECGEWRSRAKTIAVWNKRENSFPIVRFCPYGWRVDWDGDADGNT